MVPSGSPSPALALQGPLEAPHPADHSHSRKPFPSPRPLVPSMALGPGTHPEMRGHCSGKPPTPFYLSPKAMKSSLGQGLGGQTPLEGFGCGGRCALAVGPRVGAGRPEGGCCRVRLECPPLRFSDAHPPSPPPLGVHPHPLENRTPGPPDRCVCNPLSFGRNPLQILMVGVQGRELRVGWAEEEGL